MQLGPKSSKAPMSEINVTPLVDVMLVLLIIFMVTAPMMVNNIPLNLPKTKKTASAHLKAEKCVLDINEKEEIFFRQKKMDLVSAILEIQKILPQLKDQALYLRIDERLSYGKVAAMMATLKHAGINQLSLVTETKR